MRIIVDMNLSPAWAEFLAGEGFEAVHWSEVGSFDALDEAILAHALLEASVVLTCDLDFGGILAATGGKAPSVVQIRADDVSVPAIGRQLIAALRQSADQLAAGALITVEPSRMRLTILPLNRDSD